MSETPAEKLFPEFAGASTAEWQKRIEADLKGGSPERLVWKSREGISVAPFYAPAGLNPGDPSLGVQLQTEPGAFPYVRGARVCGGWEIRQEIFRNTLADALEAGRAALAGGADALEWVLSADAERRMVGVPAISVSHWTSILEVLGERALHIQAGEVGLPALALAIAAGFDPARGGSLDHDPIGEQLSGRPVVALDLALEDLTAWISYLDREHAPGFRLLAANGQPYHDAGAGLVEELALVLATGHEYLDALGAHGLDTDAVASRLHFRLSVGSNFFFEVARMRALRLLWARIVEEYRPRERRHAAAVIHGRTSNWNKTLYDAYTNMLRGTTEAMGAVLGGCDSFSVTGFDVLDDRLPGGLAPDREFADRVARNTQNVLRHEAYVDRVVDAAAGSYYVEQLTHEIGAAAWKRFQELEAAGGIKTAIVAGTIQERLNNESRERLDDVARRRILLLGANQYPERNEKLLGRLEQASRSAASTTTLTASTNAPDDSKPETLIKAARAGAGLAELYAASPRRQPGIARLKAERGARALEDLRLQTEGALERGRARPTVFVLPFGNVAMRRARASFTANFFGCVGYEIVEPESAESALNEALSKKPDLIVLCSSDEDYAKQGPELLASLREQKNQAPVLVAGNPGCRPDLEAAGVQDFIHLKSNLLETLAKYQNQLGVTE